MSVIDDIAALYFQYIQSIDWSAQCNPNLSAFYLLSRMEPIICVSLCRAHDQKLSGIADDPDRDSNMNYTYHWQVNNFANQGGACCREQSAAFGICMLSAGPRKCLWFACASNAQPHFDHQAILARCKTFSDRSRNVRFTKINIWNHITKFIALIFAINNQTVLYFPSYQCKI